MSTDYDPGEVARDHLEDAARSFEARDFSGALYCVQQAQVHATLAVAQRLGEIGLVLEERIPLAPPDVRAVLRPRGGAR